MTARPGSEIHTLAAAQRKQWVQEKQCALCSVALGYGKFRQRKFYCHICAHAVCLACSDPSLALQGRDKRTVCRACSNLPLPPSPHPFGNVSSITQQPEEGALATEVALTNLFADYSQAICAKAEQYSQHLLLLHYEACALKTQEEWYVQQLHRQDEEVQGLTRTLHTLNQDHEGLQHQIRLMEAKISKIDRSAVRREFDTCCDDECCSCVLF